MYLSPFFSDKGPDLAIAFVCHTFRRRGRAQVAGDRPQDLPQDRRASIGPAGSSVRHDAVTGCYLPPNR